MCIVIVCLAICHGSSLVYSCLSVMSKESFQKKSSTEVAEYFKNELGIPDFICQAFENEMVDGSALLDLTEQDVKDICKKIGPTKKVYRLIVEILGDAKDPEKAFDALLSVSSPSYSSGVTSDYPNTPESAASIAHLAAPRELFSASTESDDSSITTYKSSRKFIVPEKWCPSIMQCIQEPSEPEARRMLSPSVRNEIVRDLVTQMYTVWESPKTTESTIVAKMLVNKYPFMKDQGEGITGFGSWQKKIIDRLHNTRAPMKRKATDFPEDSSSAKKGGRPKMNPILSRYPALPTDMGGMGSDDVTFSRNVEKIKTEMRGSHPKKQILLQLMEETYVRRREVILGVASHTIPVAQTLDMFPCLKLYPVIQLEISLILGKKDIISKAIEVWQVWKQAVTDYCDTLKSKLFVQLKENYLKAYKDDEERDEKIALALLVRLLNKKTDALSFIYSEHELRDNPDDVAVQSNIPSPRIGYFQNGVKETTYFIFIEGRVLTQLKDFSKSLAVWFVSHYTFNLHYCKELKEVGMFVQEFLFALPSQERKTLSYITITSSIKSFVD